MKRLLVAALAVCIPLAGHSQDELTKRICVKNVEQLRLAADFQTASLICPKWNIMHRVDYAYLLMELKVITVGDLEKAPQSKPGYVRFKEPCATEIDAVETQSLLAARATGPDLFCLDMARWLTQPAVRYTLEQSGIISKD